ncbi:MAG: glycosyltransferase family 4 protein, partial [Anaerolineales bacterium]|nr:glycosyltransferase family 4 protein [Anaerolineales bacterium]
MTQASPPFRVLHQVLTGATFGDAITMHALDIQRWLHAAGIRSQIYALHLHESMAEWVRPLATYRPGRDEPFVIYHHSIGSAVPDFLLAHSPQLLLIYHNITPPDYFKHINPGWVQLAQQGLTQLGQLRNKTVLALAVSSFNETDLLAAGYRHTGILPIVLPQAQYDEPLNKELAQELDGKRPLLLFVGRFSPNKKQEDLVKLLAAYRRIQPQAHLALVGDPWVIGYDHFVQEVAAYLGVADSIMIPGKISQRDLVTYYRYADLYVSMSEHEGFGKPLIESMYLGLPVLAYAAPGVAATLGHSGVRVHEKDFARLAELTDILVSDQALRQRLIVQQQEHVQQFLETAVQQQFLAYLQTL